MNILLVNPPGSKGKSEQFLVCDYLCEKYEINAHISYSSDNVPLKNKNNYHSYDNWVIKNKQKINNKNIHDLEKEFPKSNLWSIIVSQRTYYDYSYLNGAEPHYNPKLADSIFDLKALVLFYFSIIKKYNIDTVLAHAGDNMHSTTLFVLAKSMSLKVFQTNAILFKEWLFYLCDDEYFRSSILKQKYSLYMEDFEKYVSPNIDKIKSFKQSLLGFNPVEEVKDIWKDVNSKEMLKNNVKTIKRFFVSKTNIFPGFENLGKTRVIFLKMKAAVKRYIYYFLTEYFVFYEKEITSEPFVYFPLHLQPEATLLSTTPVFSDQLSVIRAISASIPAGYMLVVKDYPLQAGYRPLSFYRQIKKLPNVILHHRLFPSLKLVDQCKMTITIQGSVGFEALLRNKKVLLLGKAIYESIYGINQVNNYKELQYSIKKFLFKKLDTKKQDRSLMAYLGALSDSLYRSSDYPEYQNDEIASASHLLITLLQKHLQFDDNKEIAHVQQK